MIALTDTVAIAIVTSLQTVLIALISIWAKRKSDTLLDNQKNMHEDINSRVDQLVASKSREARHKALDDVRQLDPDNQIKE